MIEQNETKLQIECMDVTLVTSKMLKYRNHAKKKNLIFGIIISKIRKQNRSGKPVVILKLTDNQYVRFYESDEEKIESYVKLDTGTPIICAVNDWSYLEFENKVPRIHTAY